MISKQDQNILKKYRNLCHDFISADFYLKTYHIGIYLLRCNFYNKFCYLEFMISYFKIKK